MVDGVDRGPLELADTYLRRLRGMLWRAQLPSALLLVPGGGVHGWGMRVALDVAFVAPLPDGTPGAGPYEVRRAGRLRPGGLLLAPRGTCAVLESPAGTFERWRLRPGAVVVVVGGPERPQP